MKLEALTERIMRGGSSRMFVASGYHIHGKKTINTTYHPGGKVILDFWLTALLQRVLSRHGRVVLPAEGHV
jgi:hypothetical protein